LERCKVSRLGVGQQQVKKSPPHTGCSRHELKVFGAEDHAAHQAEIVGESAYRLAIERATPFLRRPVQVQLLRRRRHKVPTREISSGPVPDHLGTADAAEGTQRGQQVNRLEDVRLALRVLPDQELETGFEIDVQSRVVPKIAQAKVRKVHGGILYETL